MVTDHEFRLGNNHNRLSETMIAHAWDLNGECRIIHEGESILLSREGRVEALTFIGGFDGLPVSRFIIITDTIGTWKA